MGRHPVFFLSPTGWGGGERSDRLVNLVPTHVATILERLRRGSTRKRAEGVRRRSGGRGGDREGRGGPRAKKNGMDHKTLQGTEQILSDVFR